MSEHTIPATGNGMKTSDRRDGFLDVSGGEGNTTEKEVHLLIRTNDGDFAQGWFLLADVQAALSQVAS